jgi:hypothetical protein
MKNIKPILISVVILIQLSCSKERSVHHSGSDRTIRFELYTKNNFSENNDNITFSLFIKNKQNRVLFDSTLSVMKIMDIPDSTRKIVFEKKVPKEDASELAAGFHYIIEGVGYSSYLDTCKAGQLLKVIEFIFQ